MMSASILLALAGLAVSHSPDDVAVEAAAPVAFDRPWAVGVYATGWEGPYGAAGIGGRLRFEVFPGSLGVEVFGESALAETPEGFELRHDHQVGFNLFVPFRFAHDWRFRPLLGFCAIFSFAEAEDPHLHDTEDILFGAHAGVGLEWSLTSWISVFVDAQAYAYSGHRYGKGRWTASLGSDLELTASIQAQAGLQLHLGGL